MTEGVISAAMLGWPSQNVLGDGGLELMQYDEDVTHGGINAALDSSVASGCNVGCLALSAYEGL